MKPRKDRGGEDMLFGINPVCEALSSGKRSIRSLWIVKKSGSGRLERIAEQASSKGIEIRWVEGAEMTRRFPDREDQGVAAITGPYPYETLEGILRSRPPSSFLLALDQVQDPRNLGAVIRSAAAFGCAGIIIHEDRSARITPVTVKASAGMTEHSKIAKVVNLASAIRQVKEAGLWVYGLDAGAPKSLFEEDLTSDIMLVLGSEGTGLRSLTVSLCDGLLRVPISPPCESLNVSAAAAIILAEASRQRMRKSPPGKNS
jgi:23S rRNA (guanosine2251-2'-O)-methyltransferase